MGLQCMGTNAICSVHASEVHARYTYQQGYQLHVQCV